MNNIVIITDGSADNRNGSGGWAAIIRTPDSLIELSGCESGTTSNRMELTAAIKGLREVPLPSTIDLVADSAYLLNTLHYRWYDRWAQEDRNGYKSRQRPNMDLWEQLIGLTSFHTVNFYKVKGHSGDYWNTRADKLAAYARRNQISERTVLPNFGDFSEPTTAWISI